MHCNWSYVLLKFLFPVMNTFTDKNNYSSNKLMERYFYNASIYIGNLALSGVFLWSWNEAVLRSPVNLVANKNKTKTSDGISILIRKISRWTITCEENFVLIKKGDTVLWLFQIRKKRRKDYSMDEWFDWCCLYLMGAGAECVVPIWSTTTVVMVNSKMNFQHQKT